MQSYVAARKQLETRRLAAHHVQIEVVRFVPHDSPEAAPDDAFRWRSVVTGRVRAIFRSRADSGRRPILLGDELTISVLCTSRTPLTPRDMLRLLCNLPVNLARVERARFLEVYLDGHLQCPNAQIAPVPRISEEPRLPVHDASLEQQAVKGPGRSLWELAREAARSRRSGVP